MPKWSRTTGESRRVELGGAEVVAAPQRGLAAALGGALDHADHHQAREGGHAGAALVREQPADLMPDRVAADLDPAVPAVGGPEDAERARRRVGEEEPRV